MIPFRPISTIIRTRTAIATKTRTSTITKTKPHAAMASQKPLSNATTATPCRATAAARPAHSNSAATAQFVQMHPECRGGSGIDVAFSNAPCIEILDNIADGIIVFDEVMNCLYVNRQGAKLLGRSPGDLVGCNYWAEYPEAKDTPFAAACVQALEARSVVSFEHFYESWQRWFENCVHPMADGVMILFSNTTESARWPRKTGQSVRFEGEVRRCDRNSREMTKVEPYWHSNREKTTSWSSPLLYSQTVNTATPLSE